MKHGNCNETASHGGDRQEMMRVLAGAGTSDLALAVAALGAPPAHVELRKPEIGLVMLRGRIGGDGAPFNIGEATVTRAVVKLQSGEIGFSYVLGRAPEKARLAALVDAIWQTNGGSTRIEKAVLKPLRRKLAADTARRRAETAATRVDFFTLVRGEDA
ncbi:MAG: phosphonate C-P lyase system protein PhnG [Proteobacteria bacterium]|nr:phosphonate C-P lyase system protein PhnG [Pseudomonadota bacterium]